MVRMSVARSGASAKPSGPGPPRQRSTARYGSVTLRLPCPAPPPLLLEIKTVGAPHILILSGRKVHSRATRCAARPLVASAVRRAKLIPWNNTRLRRTMVGLRFTQSLRFDSAFWRKLAWMGAARGPRIWLRASPAPLGVVFALLLRQPRSLVRHNLRCIAGPRGLVREQLDVARTFMAFAQSFADGLAVSGGRYQPQLEVEFGDRLHHVLEQGRGAIVVTAHTSGWETALAALSRNTCRPVLVVMSRERDDGARRLHDAYRSTMGFRIYHVGDDPLSALPMLNHLRSGGLVTFQIDRCPNGMRVRQASLFGSPFRMPEGPFTLASVSGCPILVALSRRTGFLRYQLTVSEPIRLPRHPSSQQLDSSVQTVADLLEHYLRLYPTQWFHFVEPEHRRDPTQA